MTLDEANGLAERLVSINIKIWHTSDRFQKKVLKNDFRSIYASIVAAGFKIRSGKEWSNEYGFIVPFFKVSCNRHKDCIEIIDNRSSNAKYVGDCSTRTLCFCTNMPYDDMQQYQFKLSHVLGCSWKNTRVIEKILKDYGYTSLRLPRRISRSVFIRMFKHAFQSGIIATLSSGHIAAIDMAQGKVLDTWDSTGGRIYKIFVPDGQYLAWYQTVNRI